MKINDTATGKHHLVLVQKFKGMHDVTFPALYLNVNGKPALVDSIIEYFAAFSGRSLSWMRHVSRAVGLIFDYATEYKRLHPSYTFTPKSNRELIRKFALAHLHGTIDPETGNDLLELYWPPSTSKVTKKYLTAATDYIIWCEAEGWIPQGYAVNNAFLNEHTTLQLLQQATKMRQRDMLAHSRDINETAKKLGMMRARQFIELGSGSSDHLVKGAEGKIFPSRLLVPLMMHGFIKKDGTEDITAKMYTMLLMFGGLRKSEPCHLWFNDIIPQMNGSFRGALRHPSDALTHFDKSDRRTRAAYLKELGLLPRNNSSNIGSYFAGWKDLALGADRSALIWILHQDVEKLLCKYYLKYLRYRDSLMKIRRAKGFPDHPFLFVRQDKGGIGEPYSINAFDNALERAYARLERLGYDVPRGKYSGTAPHGMRHFYGQILKDSGMPDKVIQSCMHHKSVLSQQIYTEPKYAKIKSMLDTAQQRIMAGEIENLPLRIADLGAEEWMR